MHWFVHKRKVEYFENALVIANMAEKDIGMRTYALSFNSLASKYVVDQLLETFFIWKTANEELLIPCIKALGNLAKTFEATETTIIGALV